MKYGSVSIAYNEPRFIAPHLKHIPDWVNEKIVLNSTEPWSGVPVENDTTAVDINSTKLSKIKGAKTVQADFMTYLNKPVDNLFFHHCLEHCPNPEEILELIAKHLKKGSYCCIAVPKDDTPRSVHHVAFDSVEEICPPGLEVVEAQESDVPYWKQYIAITRKT